MSPTTARRPRRHSLRAWLLAGALATGAWAAPAETPALVPDPAVRYGALPNGVRYAVHPNREPQGRASLRLVVLAGSLHEADEQRGLAHFLEHMAFNGSRHYAPGTLVEFFQRMGMSFGGDTNAFTSFDQTRYIFELSHSDEATLTEGLRVLADVAGGLLLLETEIDKERGIILSERRERDTVAYRTTVAQLEFLYGDTRVPRRMPIGTPEVVSGAPRARFTDYWDAWYRPDRLVVVATGDFDPAAVEPLIARAFGDMAARAPALPDPDLGQLPAFAGVRARLHVEPEAPATKVTLATVTRDLDRPDTPARRQDDLKLRLALGMLNRRLAELAKKEGAPFSVARADVTTVFRFIRQAGLELTCRPEQWSAALVAGEQELRRALVHGFLVAELKEVVAEQGNRLDQAVRTASTRRSAVLANGLADSFVRREVFTHPTTERDVLQPVLSALTPADCQAALREAFAGAGRFVFVTGNVQIPGDASAVIVATYNGSRTTAVTPPAAWIESSWAYADWGAPGRVTRRETVSDLGVELVSFENGVRLNLKRTDFEAGRIRVGVRAGDGALTQPADQRGLAAVAVSAFVPGGLGRHSADELRRLLAGRNVATRLMPAEDGFELIGNTTPADLGLQLELMAAQLTDAGWRPEALRQTRENITQLYQGFTHTPNGPMMLEMANLIASGDPRFGLPAKEVMLSRTLEEAKAWLGPQFARGPLEITLVGDFEPEAAIAAVARTLGALPARAPRTDLATLKHVAFPATPFTRAFRITSEIPKGNALVYWPTTDGLDIRRARRLNLLASVLRDRLRVTIREQLGDTYSANAVSFASDTFPGYGHLQSGCVVDPAQAERILEVILATGQDLATAGVTEDELARARAPVLTTAREAQRTNNYWGTALARAQERPEMLEWARTRVSDLEAITVAELNDLARTFLTRDRASRVTILPDVPPPASGAK